MQRRFAIVDLAFQHLHFHAFFAGAGNFGVKDTVAAVKQLQRLSRPHTQYAPDMVGGIFAKRDVRMAGQWFRMINAGIRIVKIRVVSPRGCTRGVGLTKESR